MCSGLIGKSDRMRFGGFLDFGRKIKNFLEVFVDGEILAYYEGVGVGAGWVDLKGLVGEVEGWKDFFRGKDKFQKGVAGVVGGGGKKSFREKGGWLVEFSGSDRDKDGSVGDLGPGFRDGGVKGDIKFCYSRKNKFWNIGDQWNTGVDTKKILDSIYFKESLAASVRPKPHGKVKLALSKSRDYE